MRGKNPQRNIAFTRILMDQGIYVSMLVFTAGLRHLIRQARSDAEWIGTLLFGAAPGWVAVTVVADGLEGRCPRHLERQC